MSAIFLGTRPPVTASDAGKLKSLWDAIPQNDIDMFEIHGYIRDIRSQRQTLLYTFEQGGKLSAKVLRLDNLDTEPLGDLYKTINQVSAVGDESIQAEPVPKELSRDRFSLNFNPLEFDNGVLASISAFCKMGVEANLSCLKVMTKDDCSEKTSDTEGEEDYVGSLVVGVPTGYEGGKLALFKGGREVAICWGAKEEEQETGDFRWAFIPLGVQYQFHAIASGYCLTWNYKIFATGAVLYKFPEDCECCDVDGLNLYKRLNSLFHDPEFLSGGGRIAFPCQCEYPTTDLWKASELGTVLKGNDYILWHASKKVGYKPRTKVVRKLSVDFDLSDTFWLEDVTFQAIKDQGNNRYPVDAFSSYNPNLGLVYLTSDSLGGPPSCTCMEEGSTAFEILGDKENGRSILETDLIWAAAPKAWVKESSFIQELEDGLRRPLDLIFLTPPQELLRIIQKKRDSRQKESGVKALGTRCLLIGLAKLIQIIRTVLEKTAVWEGCVGAKVPKSCFLRPLEAKWMLQEKGQDGFLDR